MTPLEEFKQLLPNDHTVSDEEIETMRDLIDIQADIILDAYIKTRQMVRCKHTWYITTL